jgi:hypothetical protein
VEIVKTGQIFAGKWHATDGAGGRRLMLDAGFRV